MHTHSHTHVCVCVCARECVCVCDVSLLGCYSADTIQHALTHMHPQTYTRTHTHTHVPTYIHTHTHTHTCVCVYQYAYTTHTHTKTHTYTRTHTHTRVYPYAYTTIHTLAPRNAVWASGSMQYAYTPFPRWRDSNCSSKHKSKSSMGKSPFFFSNEPFEKRPWMTIEVFGLHSDNHFESRLLNSSYVCESTHELSFGIPMTISSLVFWTHLMYANPPTNSRFAFRWPFRVSISRERAVHYSCSVWELCLFCKKTLLKKRYSAKETYNLKEPTDRSHRISHLIQCVGVVLIRTNAVKIIGLFRKRAL